MGKYKLLPIIHRKSKNYIFMGKKKKYDFILYYYVATNSKGHSYLENIVEHQLY